MTKCWGERELFSLILLVIIATEGSPHWLINLIQSNVRTIPNKLLSTFLAALSEGPKNMPMNTATPLLVWSLRPWMRCWEEEQQNDLIACTSNHRHHIRHSRSRRLCLEIPRNAPVPAVNHVAPWHRRRVRCLLVGWEDGLKMAIVTHSGLPWLIVWVLGIVLGIWKLPKKKGLDLSSKPLIFLAPRVRLELTT